MSEYKSFVAIGCTHRPIHNESYCKWILDRVNQLRPDFFIHCGDLFDQKCVSRFVKHNAPTLEEEYKSANDFLDELNHKLTGDCKKVYIQGNHCSRIFREENRQYGNLLDFRIHCDALKDWKVFDYKQHPKHVYKLGQVTFAHGWSTTQGGAITEAINLSGPNTLYIHSHTHKGHAPYQVNWGQRRKLPYWIANVGCGISSEEGYFQEWDTSQWNRGYIFGVTQLRKREKPTFEAEFVEHSKIWDE